MDILITGIITLIIGLGFGLVVYKLRRNFIINSAHEEAEILLEDIKEQLEIKQLEEKERMQEIELELWTKSENDLLKIEEKVEELTELVDEKKKKIDLYHQEEKKKISAREEEISALEAKLKSFQNQIQQKKSNLKELNHQLTQKLSERCAIPLAEATQNYMDQLVQDTRAWAQKWIDAQIEDMSEHAETRARNILDIALDRFARPYSAERGIGSVQFPDAQTRKNFLNPQFENARAIQESCGCDIIIEDSMENVGVAGYDPVRRELTRRTLEKVFKERKQITPEQIQRVAEAQKKELFKQIRHDGDMLAKELKLENLHPEIRQMMGSLRYRYSFTQNQYFHCGEVGWLCGLLASELGREIKVARRSGMLHDIGKSMDHAMDGGHAVIGADFIQSRGESPEVVHNVRAHHYDEQPSSDHAFLVIAADAISGARPGARRSTMESYNQKINELQDIARSFDGVTDCFVLNGGRECRVLVNSKRIDDNAALELSQKMARKIEDECNYPGQIKIVVVRETVLVENTMGKMSHSH